MLLSSIHHCYILDLGYQNELVRNEYEFHTRNI